MRDFQSPANEKPPYLELPVYSNGRLVYNSPPNLPLPVAPGPAQGGSLGSRHCRVPEWGEGGALEVNVRKHAERT